MGKYFTLSALLLFAAGVQAQAVFKCRDAKGQPVYQSQPCVGRSPEKVWFNQYREPTPEERYRRAEADRKIAQADQRLRASNVRYSASSSSYWSPPSQGRETLACLAARSEYNRVQKDFVLNRNIDLLRKLEADIRRECPKN